jgi:Pvc16 N-terminal domain
MIAAALTHLTRELNQSLRRGLAGDQDLVVLCNPIGPDGQLVPQAQERLAVFLVNVERDAGSGRAPARRSSGLTRMAQGLPRVDLNLLFMVAANFSGANYTESLKLLEHTVAFFQGRPVFDAQNSPELDRRIDRLQVELEDLGITDLTNLWGMLGGHYLPSLLYRVRLLRIDAGALIAQPPLIRRPEAAVGAG